MGRVRKSPLPALSTRLGTGGGGGGRGKEDEEEDAIPKLTCNQGDRVVRTIPQLGPHQWRDNDDSSGSSDDESLDDEHGYLPKEDEEDEEIVHDEEGANPSHPTSPKKQQANATWPETRLSIIAKLKDNVSAIHLLTGQTKKERCTKMWQKYASGFDEKIVVCALSRVLLQRDKKEGPFSEKNSTRNSKDVKPIWRTRSEISPAYSLLYKLRLHSEDGTGIDKMSADDIYKHHDIFHQYELKEFRKWDKDMVKLTDKHRLDIDINVKLFMEHCIIVPKKSVTSRGKLFWSMHSAKDRLAEDTKSGRTKQMKPKELWKSHDDYQDFSLEDFRKHIYQEKYKQLAGPYWQKKRNKIGLKEHEKTVRKLYQEWHHTKWESDMNDLAQQLKEV